MIRNTCSEPGPEDVKVNKDMTESLRNRVQQKIQMEQGSVAPGWTLESAGQCSAAHGRRPGKGDRAEGLST